MSYLLSAIFSIIWTSLMFNIVSYEEGFWGTTLTCSQPKITCKEPKQLSWRSMVGVVNLTRACKSATYRSCLVWHFFFWCTYMGSGSLLYTYIHIFLLHGPDRFPNWASKTTLTVEKMLETRFNIFLSISGVTKTAR